MGLAASQARFLAVTARKADCEFRSMQIAQNKLSVTRELQAATQTYQKALNATMFVWDGDGAGQDPQAFSYGIMMTPSVYNNYNPYLLTDRSGRLIVTDNIAKAAKAAGIDADLGGTRSDANFIKFLDALGANHVISAQTADDLYKATFANATYIGYDGNKYTNIQDATPVYVDSNGNKLGNVYSSGDINNWREYYKQTPQAEPAGTAAIGYAIVDNNVTKILKSNYNAENGYGAEPMGKNQSAGINVSQLIQAFKEGKIKSAGEYITLDNDIKIAYNNTNQGNIYKNRNKYAGTCNSEQTIKISDILSSNWVIQGNSTDVIGDSKIFQEIINQIGLALGVYKDINGEILPADEDYAKTFDTAKNLTLSQFGSANSLEISGHSAHNANDYNAMIKKSNEDFAVSLTNMVKYFLTSVTMLEDGFKSNYKLEQSVKNSYFVTQDPSYRWVVNKDDTVTETNVLKSDFYMQLFNNLCVNGYKTDAKADDDSKYLEQMLKNGSYFISSIGNDGYFYQAKYSDADNTRIMVVDDEDAIAVAEAEYNYQKIRLTAKEDKLDLDMKNIDMEISALTTEYDAVKNLIAKSVEKTFKQFEG